MGQAALGVAVGGPGIAEVDVHLVHLVGGEVVPQAGGIPVDEEHVGQALGHAALHGHDHGVGDPLQGDIEGIRVLLGGLGGKAALAAAQLQPQVGGIRLQIPPVSPIGGGVPDQKPAAPLHPGAQVGLFSHSHGIHLVIFLDFYLITDT